MSEAIPANSRALLYELCADLVTREVDEARLDALRPMAPPLVQAAPDLADWLESADGESLEKLRVEFARLFLVRQGVSPFASAWDENADPSAANALTAAISEAMKALDLEQTEAAGTLPLDHLGLIFSVVSQALRSEIPERRQIGEQIEQAALGDWVQRFGAALEKDSCEPLYRALGVLIQDVMMAIHP